MNRALSKPTANRRAEPKPQPKSKIKIRSPLKDLNAGIVFKSRSSNCSSSSSSTEPTAVCSRFRSFNSSSTSTNPDSHQQKYRSDCNSRNPRNVATTKPRLKSCKQLDQGRKIGNGSTESEADRVPKGIRLRRCQTISQKKVVTAGMVQKRSGSGRLDDSAGKSGNDFQFTPLGCKIGSMECGFDKILSSSNCDKNDDSGSSNCDKNDDSGSGNTPPAEATVSPEIQCGSMTVMSVATPVCFGAGHVLSGVSDKRKCRPRGVLVVGGNCNGIDGLNSSNEDLDGIGDVDSSRGLVPLLPAEASVHWLLSPCEEDDVDQNGISELLTSVRLQSSLSGSSGSLSHSPTCATPNDGVVSWFDENTQGTKDTLGSENVIQTPESYSSLERHMSLPWLYADDGKHVVNPNLDCAVDDKHKTRASSECQILVPEQIESSFEFDCHLKPTSSIEFSHLQYNWDHSSWISDEIVENEQQSQFRISWKDGLSCHHHIEMENADCTRILSDEEDKNDQCFLNPASIKPVFPEISTSSFIKKIDVKSAGCMNRDKNYILQKDIQCAESISLNGGSSLAASGDSEWDTCYKDSLFQEE